MLQLQITNFKKGTYIVVEGRANSDKFYIIQQGTVQCMKASGSGIAPVRYGPGDFIGVVPCMSGQTQIETAVALTDVVAISVKKEQYPELIEKNTPVAIKIIKTFANRMRVMNGMLTKATLKSVGQDTYDQIYNVAKYYDTNNKHDIAVYAYYQYLKTKPVGPKADDAKKRFVTLKPKTNAVYYEPTPDSTREYPADTMIFSDAQRGADMYIIQSGQVSISKIVNGKEITFALLGKGDMFGEMALLENKPRSASAIAHSNCRLMVVNIQNFNQMVTTQPQMIAKLTTTLADRLWSMYRQLDNANIPDPIHKMIDMLALQIEKSKIQMVSNTQHQTEITPQDLANMCGLPAQIQQEIIPQFNKLSIIRISPNGKILVKDLFELSKQSAFYRKQSQE